MDGRRNNKLKNNTAMLIEKEAERKCRGISNGITIRIYRCVSDRTHKMLHFSNKQIINRLEGYIDFTIAPYLTSAGTINRYVFTQKQSDHCNPDNASMAVLLLKSPKPVT